MKKKGNIDARTHYAQSALSGFGNYVQPENKDDSGKKGKPAKVQNPFFWQQKKYVVYVPIIITETNVSNDKYEYTVSIPSNVDVPISPYKPKSKNLIGQAFGMAKTQNIDNSKIHMVYGIPKEGSDTLPPVVIDPLDKSVSYIYGGILGQVARAVKCIVQFSGKGKELPKANDDTGQRDSQPHTRIDVGKFEDATRSTKIRREIRAKRQAESSTILDDKDREILGERQGDGSDRLVRLGSDTFEGTGLEGGVVEF